MMLGINETAIADHATVGDQGSSAQGSAAQGSDPQGSDPWAAFNSPPFINIGRGQGLPHPIAMALAQDGQGFLWIGTQGGLARYDGYRVRTYLHDDADPGSLPNNVVSALATDVRGRLWVGGLSGDIGRYDPLTDAFTVYPPPAGTPAWGGVFMLAGDGGDGVWAASALGLEHILPATPDTPARIIRYTHHADDPLSLPDDHTRSVTVTGDGSVWVGTTGGLARMPPGGRGFQPVPVVGTDGRPLTVTVTSLLQDSAGRLWFGTDHAGIGRMLPDDPRLGRAAKSWQPAHLLDSVVPPTSTGNLNFTLAEGRPGEIWVGTLANGITILDAATGRPRGAAIRHDPAQPTSFADDSARALLHDRQGMMWVATNVGVSRTNLEASVIDNVLPRQAPGGLPDPNVLTLDVPPSGTLAGTGTGADSPVRMGFKGVGVATLDPRAGTITAIPAADGLPMGTVAALFSDPTGRLWAGARSGRRLMVLPPGGDRFQPVPDFPATDFAILAGVWQDGALWVGAGALVRYDPANRQATVYHHGGDPASLLDESIDAMAAAGSQGLWIGTRRGLDHFDIKTGKFRHYLHDPHDPRSLPAPLVSTLMVDDRGRLWVGTLGGGIGVLETPGAGGDGRFIRLSMHDGLPNDNIGAMREDRRGRVWVTTADGLALIDSRTLAVHPLTRGDGLAIDAYWINSAATAADGTLLFGGGGGLTVIHPDRYHPWDYKPPLVVTGLRVNGHPVPPGLADRPGGLMLSPRQRALEVSFAALDYSEPGRLRYIYKLQGFDDDWISTDAERRVAAYTNLPPGRYTLMLRGTNRAGGWGATRLIPVTVEPAWWQTLWFRLALAGLGLAAVAGLVQGRTAYLRHRRAVLEDLVDRQTRDLMEANRRLEELASRDSLTGIYNRRYFTELAERDLERGRRTGSPVSLAIIDLDHFKAVNDSHGHMVGDEVLRAVVDRIAQSLRTTDLFARLGGEELVVLMPETDAAAAYRVARRLQLALADQDPARPTTVVPVTISVGVATTPAGRQTLDILLERADQALYTAKRQGRNRVAVAPDLDSFDPDAPAGVNPDPDQEG